MINKLEDVTCKKTNINYLPFLFLITNLSMDARTAGNSNNIISVEHSVPSDIVLHIFAVIAVDIQPTIRVTITRIDALVNIVWIDLL